MGDLVILPTVRIEREAKDESAKQAIERYFEDMGWPRDHLVGEQRLTPAENFLVSLYLAGYIVTKAPEPGAFEG